jgi:surface antigen
LGEVIELKFRIPHTSDDDATRMLACAYCRNKTYTFTYDGKDGFPLMKCAACGQHHGRIGYVHDD